MFSLTVLSCQCQCLYAALQVFQVLRKTSIKETNSFSDLLFPAV